MKNEADKKTQRISIRVTPEEKERIDKMSEFLEIPTTTLGRNLLLTSLEDQEMLKMLGITKGKKKIEEFIEKFQEAKEKLKDGTLSKKYLF